MSNSMTANVLQNSSDLIERYANCILKDFKGSNKTEILDKLAGYVLYFSKAVKYNELSDKIFDGIVNDIDSAEVEPNLNEVLMQFNEAIENIQEELESEEVAEKFNNFKKLFLEEDSKIDDDITAVCQNLNTIDPISKLPITDPVKNKICGHVYEKSTIIELIDHNPRTKCPIAGCNAIEFIKKSDLVPDTATKRVICQSAGNPQKKAKLDE